MTEKKVFELLQNRNAGDFVPIKDVVLNALEKIEKASKNKGTVTGIPTGFPGSGLQTIRIAAVGPDSCGGASIYG